MLITITKVQSQDTQRIREWFGLEGDLEDLDAVPSSLPWAGILPLDQPTQSPF